MRTDQIVIRQAIDGDERALRQLWKEHSPHIDAVVLRLCGDRELAADIAQEVWIQIFRALPAYRGDSQFGTWAHRIAVNRTLNALRKVRRIARVETDMEDASSASATAETGAVFVSGIGDTESEIERTFLAETIDQALQRLSPGARTVFTLHDIEGYTHEEIAEELGITPGGSKSQLFKARAKLRRMLSRVMDGHAGSAGQMHVTPT